MTNPLSPDDPERDAWLREALRHAPDARAEPSAALRETILRQARAAATTAPPPHRPDPWRALNALWSWLARPTVAAGFTSVMVATVVGLMWWDRPLDETLSRPPASAPALPSVPAPPAGNVATDTRAAPPAARRPPAARTDQAPARAVAPAEPGRARESETAPPAAAAEMSTPARDESIAASPHVATRGLAKAAAPAAPTPLAELRASVAAQPQRWAWQRSGDVQPMNPALQRWLQQLEHATAPHWQAAGAVPTDGNGVRLYRDGALQATLLLSDAGAALVSAAGQTTHAALAPAPLAALKRALDEATR